MDKILFIRQNPKDFTCEEHYSSLKRIFKHGINLLGLLLLFLFVNITFVHAQAVKLSLNKQNATYEEIFNEIEEKTGYKFVYNTSEIDRNERTSIQGTSMDLNELLRNLFRSKRNISFRISNKHIALFKAQIKTISGTVVDTQGESVIGANVLVKVAQPALLPMSTANSAWKQAREIFCKYLISATTRKKSQLTGNPY